MTDTIATISARMTGYGASLTADAVLLTSLASPAEQSVAAAFTLLAQQVVTESALLAGLISMPPVPAGVPFDASSPWNESVGSGAGYAAIPGLSKLATGLSTWLNPNNNSLEIYFAKSTDPQVPVLYCPSAYANVANGQWKRAGNSAAIEAAIMKQSVNAFPTSGNSYSSQSAMAWILPMLPGSGVDPLINPASGPLLINLPAGDPPELGYDGHIAVYQPTGKVFEADSAILLSTGQIVCLQYHLTDPTGRGDGYENGITASMIPVYAGVITAADIAAGTIAHAMKIVVPPSLLTASWTDPALAFDRTPNYSGNLPMGCRLAIPLATNLSSLKLTTPIGKMIGAAAQTYGFIICDRGGGGITVEAQGNSGSALLNTWTQAENNDLTAIVHALQQVT